MNIVPELPHPQSRMMRFLRLATPLIACFFLACGALAQVDGVHHVGDDPTRFLVRLQNKGLLPTAFLSHRPLSVYEARSYADSVDWTSEQLTGLDRDYLRKWLDADAARADNLLASWIPSLYQNGSDFLSVTGEDYALQLNPLLYVGAGPTKLSRRVDRDDNQIIYRNTRGVRFSGHVGRFFVETRFEETQQDAPAQARRWIIQRLGRVNHPVATEDELLTANNLDYFIATGLIGYRAPHVELRLGRDRNRWGFGTNSLTLSDFSYVYDQFQVRLDLWRLQYVSLFTSLSDRNAGRTGLEIPPKFGVFHRLAVRISDRVRVGLFESVVFTPDDASESGSYFGFLNPVIFYRSVDGDIGSPGNIVIGVDGQWIVHPGYVIYGQLALDEFRLSEFFRARGWWKNTYGVQGGVRVSDLLVRDLDLVLEYARIRPYMYSNKTPSLSYLHSRGVLGHSAGPNAVDWTMSAEYRPIDRLTLAVQGAHTRRGLNTSDQNFGGDPSTSYDTNRVDSLGDPLIFGVEILQGVRQTELLAEARVSYELWTNASLEAAMVYQSIRTQGEPKDRYVSAILQLRWGLPFGGLRY